jgi:glycosyltransferase involved in cell wall biosynthesis
MAMGKPVIATAYSGNMDFCNEETALLVPYDLLPVKPGEYPHWEGQHWAEPDVEAASLLMERLVDGRQFGQALGQRARVRLATGFGYLPVGLRYAKRVETLEREMASQRT